MAYVLKDETLHCNLAHSNHLYRLMKRVDPKRDSVLITMNRQTQSFLEESDLPVICSDIYYFGHDKSINICNPADKSQQEFRTSVAGINKIAEKHHKHSWLMPQMFSDIWGRHYLENGQFVVEPGSYLHWRMPTNTEVRWQIWEAIRSGSKGIIFYVLFPPIPLMTLPDRVTQGSAEALRLSKMDRKATMARKWPDQELTCKQIRIDQGEGVMLPGGIPTPQMSEMNLAFRHLRRHAALLTMREKSDIPVFFADNSKIQTATFCNPNEPHKRYGVIVNDELEQPVKFKILLPPNVNCVRNLNRDRHLTVQKENSLFLSCEMELAPGDGCLVEALFKNNHPGMLLLQEDFAQSAQYKIKVNSENARIERWGSFGIEPFYRIKMANDPNSPVFTLENLTNGRSAVNTVFMNINRSQRHGIVYCRLEGHNLKGVRINCISDQNSSGQKTNVMHLAERDKVQNVRAAASSSHVITIDKPFIPAAIPAGTAAMEFFMHEQAWISSFSIWFVPD
jgi:hypothetical protein